MACFILLRCVPSPKNGAIHQGVGYIFRININEITDSQGPIVEEVKHAFLTNVMIPVEPDDRLILHAALRKGIAPAVAVP
jgi:hypothetical protein